MQRFHMHPTKSPGLDGFPPLFYQQYWPLLGSFVSSFVVNVLASGVVPADLNQTFLDLILKCKELAMFTYFRAISLCN